MGAMNSRARIFLGAVLLVSAMPSALRAGPQFQAAKKLALNDGWAIQSSAAISAPADVLSRPGFKAQGWYPASVPNTVLAVLIENKLYPDPYFGMNLRSIPGAEYEIGKNFSNLPMPSASPFRNSWWYRTEFDVPAAMSGKILWLEFQGINYRADIWLNGRPLARASQIAGAFRRYEFDVTRFILAGKMNALAVEVFPPQPGDLAITWVDWNPAPPDKDMGLWGDVSLSSSGPVAVRHPQVITTLDLPSLDAAHLTVTAEVNNATDRAVQGTLEGAIEAIHFSQAVELGPHEMKRVTFTPETVPQLNLSRPRLWWPYRLGPQNLYELALEFKAGDQVSDRQLITFGISQITSELTEKGYRLFKVNGKKILIRGGGWAPDMMLRPSRERLEAQFRYVKEMGLNTIRLEGKLESDDFFDLADRYGILVMAGWCCCDHWEHWSNWTPEDRAVSVASLTDQILRLRNHPSVLVWLNGSDNPPPEDVERAYLGVLKACNWPKPILSSATEKKSSVTGATGVKMPGVYDYVPPSYWSTDTRNGGAFGFNTETGPGAAVPPLESLKQMLPKEHLWPIDEYWNFHAGGGQFKDLKRFTAALEKRYGTANSVEDYSWKAQAMAYEGERAMFEAYGRNKYTSTGVIQWMLNNAWPSMIWHLYDYYLRPGGGYYGTKKACEPLHVQYSYDDRSIVVVNEYQRPFPHLKLAVRVYDLTLTEKFARRQHTNVPADSSLSVMALPEIAGLTTTYFLRLTLEQGGQIISSNFYWLPTKPDVLDWRKSNWYITPVKSYADLTSLAQLPKAKLNVSSHFEARGAEGVAQVHIENPSPHLALLVRLKVTRGKGADEVLPVWWEDNYFELFPGEVRDIRAAFRAKDLAGAMPAVEVDGWNVAKSFD